MAAVRSALLNRRILITRAANQSQDSAEVLRAGGAEVIAIPTTELCPPDNWSEVDIAVGNLGSFDWLIFASANAVKFFLERVRQLGQLHALTVSIAAVGRNTAKSLEPYGVKASFVPSQFTAEAFCAEFLQRYSLDGKKILWPRGNLGSLLIRDKLSQSGACLRTLECYRNVMPSGWEASAQEVLKLLQEQKLDAALFASGQSARNFRQMLEAAGGNADNENLTKLVAKLVIAAIGPETASACRESLGRCDVVATVHTIDGLIVSVGDYFSKL
jgi:uroporphyrinogen III methyltransferase/synthase